MNHAKISSQIARWPAICAILALLSGAACSDDGGPNSANPTDGSEMSYGDMHAPDMTIEEDLYCPPEEMGEEPDDLLSPGRRLRRAALVLRGAPPALAELEAMEAAPDPDAFVDAFIDEAMQDPAFYRVLVESGREWFNMPPAPRTADAPEYGLPQQRVVKPCAEDTVNAGMLHYNRQDYDDGDSCDNPDAPKHTLEPWWAPGTQVTLVGSAANTSPTGKLRLNSQLTDVACSQYGPAGTCGCDVAAVRCNFDGRRYSGWGDYLETNAEGHRRMMSEEPARLFAHIVWHDRPATDLVLGTYMVGPTKTQSAYIMQGIRGGKLDKLDDRSWWDPALFAGAPTDPDHEPTDPLAWREFQQPDRNPFLLAARDTKYDPRDTLTPLTGIPAAGMLTSMGMLASWPRERLRAARLLEALACETFSPPGADQQFNEYREDPAAEGTCQHCHRRIDPAAMHFKRFAKAGSAMEGWGASYYMPGIGEQWHWSKNWVAGQYPYLGNPFSHWRRWYTPGTRMTPVTEEQAMTNPEAVFIDFLPPDQTLLGQVSDGTVGPLGFGKLIVSSGAFDRCLTRQVHKIVMGRDIDPATEAGYLEALTTRFVAQQRSVRALIKELIRSDLFKRGI
jgi:hypothetical protein